MVHQLSFLLFRFIFVATFVWIQFCKVKFYAGWDLILKLLWWDYDSQKCFGTSFVKHPESITKQPRV